MATTSAQYAVTTSAVKIASADSLAENIYLHTETGVCYLGGDSTVSSTTGYKLDVNDKITIANHEGELWVIAAVAATVSVLSITR
jgi:hypothetical protein